MSHSSSPTNRSSIFGWVKNLKRGSVMSNESVNEISDKEDNFNFHNNAPESFSVSSPSSEKKQSTGSDFLRPSLLNHKSRSTNNINRIRSNSLNQSDKSLRQHRDSFLQHNPLIDENSKYFGVPLEDAIDQACAKISILTSEPGNVLQYGRIPIVVAKCAIYIKKNGLNVEGIFRVGGSSKRLKELQLIFNSPPDFGKKLNWDGYTVHDASSILRRYLNALPEPLIPLDLYEDFREPLRQRQRIINYMKYKAENPKTTTQHKDPHAQQPSQQPPQQQQPQEQPSSSQLPPTQVSSPGPSDDLPAHNLNIPVSPLETPVDNPDTPLELLDSSQSQPLTEANIDRLNSVEQPDVSLSPHEVSTHSQIPTSTDVTNTTSVNQDAQAAQDAQEAKQHRKTKNYKKLTKEVHEAIEIYKQCVDRLPELSKQLLFYILDLLAMVQTQSSENLMSSRNLAAIFQPSILSHPNHDLDPVEYALSQSVVEFLIRYAYKLLPNQNGEEPKVSKSSGTNSVSGSPKDDETKTLVGKDSVSPGRTSETAESGAIPIPVPIPSGSQNQLPSSFTSSPPMDNLMAAPSTASAFKRQHSRSVSSNQSHDMVGYNNGKKKLPILDSDNENNSIDFDITDDDEISSAVNKSNLTLGSDFKIYGQNIDSVLNQLDLEANQKSTSSTNVVNNNNDVTLTSIQNDTTINQEANESGLERELSPVIIVEPPAAHEQSLPASEEKASV